MRNERKPALRAGWALAILIGIGTLCALPGRADPWLPVGDRGLRSDVELLAARGLIDNLTTTWPLPAGQLRRLKDEERLGKEPEYVQRAARRVLNALRSADEPIGANAAVDTRFTSQPALVRDFGAEARNKLDVRGGFGWEFDRFAFAIRAGEQSRFDGSEGKPTLDGSYFSSLIGNWQFYGGWIDKWYGPGWTSSLILSNNARPFPKIGLMRNDPHAYESPWLHWLGPIQVDFFGGVLDGPRIDEKTAFGSLRIALAPVRGLEIAIERSTMFCGHNHPCKPLSAAFHFGNSNDNTNSTNDEASLELKYTANLGALTLTPYAQLMNEDNGPFVHADTSYLGGFSLAGPLGAGGARWRMVAEYADSVPTVNWFGFNKTDHGVAYNNFQYRDGWRYRDRTLGFSLDSDSRLLSLANLFTDRGGRSYRVVYYRARISTPQLAAIQASGTDFRFNSVSAQPADLDAAEAGITLPFYRVNLELSARWQSERLQEQNSRWSGEAGISLRF